MEEEIWLPIVGYSGLYEVSSLGNIRSLGRLKKPGIRSFPAKPIRLSVLKCGYLNFSLVKDGRQKRGMVHMVVARAFLGPKPPGLVTDHINRIKIDNRASNLRYISQSGNVLNSSVRFSHGNQSLPRGVTRIRTGMYGAQIKSCGVWKWLGTHPTSTDAELAYIKAQKAALMVELREVPT